MGAHNGKLSRSINTISGPSAVLVSAHVISANIVVNSSGKHEPAFVIEVKATTSNNQANNQAFNQSLPQFSQQGNNYLQTSTSFNLSTNQPTTPGSPIERENSLASQSFGQSPSDTSAPINQTNSLPSNQTITFELTRRFEAFNQLYYALKQLQVAHVSHVPVATQSINQSVTQSSFLTDQSILLNHWMAKLIASPILSKQTVTILFFTQPQYDHFPVSFNQSINQSNNLSNPSINPSVDQSDQVEEAIDEVNEDLVTEGEERLRGSNDQSIDQSNKRSISGNDMDDDSSYDDERADTVSEFQPSNQSVNQPNNQISSPIPQLSVHPTEEFNNQINTQFHHHQVQQHFSHGQYAQHQSVNQSMNHIPTHGHINQQIMNQSNYQPNHQPIHQLHAHVSPHHQPHHSSGHHAYNPHHHQFQHGVQHHLINQSNNQSNNHRSMHHQFDHQHTHAEQHINQPNLSHPINQSNHHQHTSAHHHSNSQSPHSHFQSINQSINQTANHTSPYGHGHPIRALDPPNIGLHTYNHSNNQFNHQSTSQSTHQSLNQSNHQWQSPNHTYRHQMNNNQTIIQTMNQSFASTASSDHHSELYNEYSDSRSSVNYSVNPSNRHTPTPTYQRSINQTHKQSINQSNYRDHVSYSNSHYDPPSVSSTSHKRSYNQSQNHSTNQSHVSSPMNNQSNNRSINQPINQSLNQFTPVCSSPSSPSVNLADFTLLSVLGRGSFGKVMLVRKVSCGSIYALKVLSKAAIAQRRQVAHTLTERAVLAYLRHPNIVALRYAFQSSSKLYFVLDFCPGGELFFHLARSGRFTEHRARFYAAQIVLALEHLHENCVIYRDLKPENVLLDEHGNAKLTDFGLSKEGISDNFSAHSFCGTPEYLAPEIVLRSGHGQAADWWSLGALLYEMVVGMPPFYSKQRDKLFSKILTSHLRIPKSLSASCANLLVALLDRNPATRIGAAEIKAHPFFDGLDWLALERGDIVPPFKPELRFNTDTTNFDAEFTTLPLHSLEDNTFMRQHSEQQDREDEILESEFANFSFVGEHEMN